MSFRRRSLVPMALLAAAAAVTATVSTLGAVSSQAATCNGYVGLTFDDGPQGGTTTNLLNALTQNGLKATLFNEGQYASANPASVRAEAAAGMWIGNHSWDHPHMTQLSQANMDSQISRTQNAISSAGGGTPKLFRPPYGETNSTLKSVEAKYGLKEIIWDVDSQDWNGASVSAIVSAASNLQNGQVILMHEWPANTVQAIPQIANNLRNRGMCSGMIDTSTGRAVAPGGTNPPPSSSTPVSPPPSSSTPPPPSGSCTASYSTSAQWNTGFNGAITVSGKSAWTVTINLPGNEKIISLWGGTATTSGNTVTVKPPSYGGNSIGFTASTTGSFAAPTATCA